MKSHYRTEAEFYADYHAMMAAREQRPLQIGNGRELQHSKTIKITRNGSVTGALAHTKPIPIRRPALPIERKWIRRDELQYTAPRPIARTKP